LKRPIIYLEPKIRALRVINLLEKEYTKAKTALKYIKPLELLIATILSAQCTDKRVNIVTKSLFKKYLTIDDYANAELKELEECIRSTGFYRSKAKYIKKSAQMINTKYESKVPSTMEELIKLPGVARKTANIVLFNAYGIISGVAVDTHVKRLTQRIGLTKNKDPNKIESDLMKIVPHKKWMKISDLLIFHGREICKARKLRCTECVLNKICSSANII
jgi:endonuclease-3